MAITGRRWVKAPSKGRCGRETRLKWVFFKLKPSCTRLRSKPSSSDLPWPWDPGTSRVCRLPVYSPS